MVTQKGKTLLAGVKAAAKVQLAKKGVTVKKAVKKKVKRVK